MSSNEVREMSAQLARTAPESESLGARTTMLLFESIYEYIAPPCIVGSDNALDKSFQRQLYAVLALSQLSKAFRQVVREEGVRHDALILRSPIIVSERLKPDEVWNPLIHSPTEVISSIIYNGGQYLRALSLCLWRVEEEILPVIAKQCRLLDRVEFRWATDPSFAVCRFFDTASLVQFFRSVVPLQYISVYCVNGKRFDSSNVVDDSLMKTIAEHQPLLRGLGISIATYQPGFDIPLQTLEALQIVHDDGIHVDQDISFPGWFLESTAQLPLLTTLSLRSIPFLGDRFLHNSLPKLFNLRSLSLGTKADHTPKLSDEDVGHIGRTCTRLNRIVIANEPYVSGRGLQMLIGTCTELVELDASGTGLMNKFTSVLAKESLGRLCTACPPSLIILRFSLEMSYIDTDAIDMTPFISQYPRISFQHNKKGYLNGPAVDTRLKSLRDAFGKFTNIDESVHCVCDMGQVRYTSDDAIAFGDSLAAACRAMEPLVAIVYMRDRTRTRSSGSWE